MSDKNHLEKIRHSLSHLMSMAIVEIYPQAGLGVGPTIENGFYQDYDLPQAISESILPKLEKRVRELIKKDIKFGQHDVSFADALKFYKNDPYKTELIQDLKKAGEKTVSFYKSDWYDNLCKGPHIKSTREINPDAFKLTKIAGAYWRGDEKNKMLTRIYGVAFESEQELKQHLEILAEAKKRDHRKLGQELDLFLFHDSAPGMPYWLPKGLVIYNELISFWRLEHQDRGYQEISTPLINKKSLYETSGHWQYYQQDMFIAKTSDEQVYALKPMNCPNAMVIFASKKRSYKEFPLRLGDVDRLHRLEASGTLNGLLRVRSFQQDDAHIFITEDQIKSEYEELFKIVERFYSVFGLEYSFRLGTRPKKYMGDKKTWDKAEEILKRILENSKKEFVVEDEDGAFYGPKIDILMKDCLGRSWQMGTLQLDFQIPKKFNLKYTNHKGQDETPITIHRVIYGSLERFIGILTEHCAGAFPLWLSPVQVMIIPVGQSHIEFSQKLAQEFREQKIRVEVDDVNETVGNKIRKAIKQKLPYMLVIGDKEIKSKSLHVRKRGEKEVKIMAKKKFLEVLTRNIQERSCELGSIV